MEKKRKAEFGAYESNYNYSISINCELMKW